MTKYTPADVQEVAEGLKDARDRSRPVSFLTGAGCTSTANIPNASVLIERIHDKYPKRCAKLVGGDRQAYGACMALLTINERRDLFRPYLEKAKINWGTIALAQLIGSGFIGRVFTVNFDLVLENACGLLGLRPAVYDFGVAPANDPDLVVSPSIIHLHGQSYGLVLLNTEGETRKHREKLQPILTDSLRSAPLVVAGYSGSADGIVQILLDQFDGSERLYWLGHGDEPADHIKALMGKDYFQISGWSRFRPLYD